MSVKTLRNGGLALSIIIAALGPVRSGPPTREEAERREKLVAHLKVAVPAEATSAGKVMVLSRAYKAETSPDIRRVIFDHIPTQPDAALDRFLIDVLTGDRDGGIRSLAATTLGARGTDQCLAALARSAATDEPTDSRIGCIGGKMSARRSATFAIADLTARYPKLAEPAAAALRKLDPVDDPKDGDSLADARLQALYQVTRDEKLLAPFLERLQSKDAKVRERGVVAFRFLKLKTVPPELAATLTDSDPNVRLWAVMVVGEVADPKMVPQLMSVAGDPAQDVAVRNNAILSLGRLKAVAAKDLMRRLLQDEKETIQVQAAIALYRLTGEKAKQFPAGYQAD